MPVFVALSMPLNVAPFIYRPADVVTTFPLKVAPDWKYNVDVPVSRRFCGEPPTWVKFLNNNEPVS